MASVDSELRNVSPVAELRGRRQADPANSEKSWTAKGVSRINVSRRTE